MWQNHEKLGHLIPTMGVELDNVIAANFNNRPTTVFSPKLQKTFSVAFIIMDLFSHVSRKMLQLTWITKLLRDTLTAS